MSFDPNVPNASQSPGLFPVQNSTNFTRLKTIINSDHVFNDTAQSTDGYHKQMTLVARATPSSLPSGSNAVLYTKLNGASQAQLRFYNGNQDYQITPSPDFIFGTINFPNTNNYHGITNVPPNVYGEVFLYKDGLIQVGAFESTATTVSGFSYAQNFPSSSNTSGSIILKLGFTSETSGLTLVAKSFSGTGVWNYRLFYRLK